MELSTFVGLFLLLTPLYCVLFSLSKDARLITNKIIVSNEAYISDSIHYVRQQLRETIDAMREQLSETVSKAITNLLLPPREKRSTQKTKYRRM